MNKTEYVKIWLLKNPNKSSEYAWNRKLRAREKMKKLKINGCAICGYNKCNDALDFHHTNPEDKKFPLSIDGMNRTPNAIINEVNKCILLCRNCHTEIHAKAKKR